MYYPLPQKTIANLTLVTRTKAGNPDLKVVLGNLKELRMATSKTAKSYASQASCATSAAQAKEILDEGLQSLEDLYSTSVSDCKYSKQRIYTLKTLFETGTCKIS